MSQCASLDLNLHIITQKQTAISTYYRLLKMKKILTIALALGLISTACTAQGSTTDNKNDSPIKVTGRLISQEDFIKAAESTVNGVVSVKSYATPQMQRGNAQGYGMDPFFEFFFGNPYGDRRQEQPREQPRQQQLGLGSGVIISEDGYIVTNNHVIEKAERLEVTLNDNRNFAATVIGADPTTDLALIKIDAPGLHVIPMGDSEELHVGEWVLAVGNPFGFTSTVTSGIISAKARNISTMTGGRSRGIESYIQTDAAVNQGNSGGALVNLEGELVGINTAIYSQTGAYAGCSFAIPTSIVEKVVADLKEYGTVQRAYLGISFTELTPELIAEKKLEGPTAGIYVASVEDRSAAREAGLEPGDIIVSMNGKPTRSTAELQEAIAKMSPGDNVTIQYYRDGKASTTQTTLRNNRGDMSVTKADSNDILGAKLEALDKETAKRLEIRAGVSVADVDASGRFAQAGIRKGFIILGVNGTRVSSPEEFKEISKSVLSSPAGQDKVLFISGIYPTGKTAYYAVALD